MIGIVGFGVVGRAVEYCLKTVGHHTKVHDISMNTSLRDLLDTDRIFVCVPTPTDDEGRCDISQVDQVVNDLCSMGYAGLIVIKSTVSPGTAKKLIASNPGARIASNPEFLRQASAMDDIMDQDVLIIGASDIVDYELVETSFSGHYQSVVRMSNTEAEIFKYYSNVHNALKVIFANGMYEVCDKMGQDYDRIFTAAENKKTMNTSYLRCFPHKRGFDGACLPKDTLAWMTFVKDLGIDMDLFSSIVSDNTRFKR